MSGELLFEATATLRVPADVDPADLRAALEAIANELMVDLDVTDRREAGHAQRKGVTMSELDEAGNPRERIRLTQFSHGAG